MQKRSTTKNLTKTDSKNDPGYQDFLKVSNEYSDLLRKIHMENTDTERVDVSKYTTDYKAEIDKFKNFIKSNPTSVFAKTSLNTTSHILGSLNDYEGMKTFLSGIINNKNLSPLIELAKLQMINYYNHKQDYSSALSLADEIIVAKDVDKNLICRALYSKGLLNEYSVDNKEEAIKNFNSVVNNYPDESLVKYAVRQLAGLGIEVKEIKGQEAVPKQEVTGYSISNYPNPFNPATTINYAIPKDGKVEIKVYDMLGREVATLVNEYKTAGKYEVTFNADNLSSGVYLYTIRAGDFSETKKLMLMK